MFNVILGLFAYSHMEFEADRDTGPTGDPSLADMTSKALSVLERSNKGYFLFVESKYARIGIITYFYVTCKMFICHNATIRGNNQYG